MKKPKILSDHKQKGRILIPPFTHMLGPMNEISWIKTILPELLWIALIHNSYGDKRAVELITSFTRIVRNLETETTSKWFAAMSHYSSLAASDYKKLLVELDKQGILIPILSAITPLVGWYPECPLAHLFSKKPPRASPRALSELKQLVAGLYNRSSRSSTMVQATAMWLAFDADILKVSPDLSLARFPEVQHYPETDISRKIGASIRAGLNGFFGSQIHYSTTYSWPHYFWNRGLAIDPCELPQ